MAAPRRPGDALQRLDREHLVHGFGSPAVAESEGTIRLVRGRGIYVWDSDGKRYIDAMASLWNVAAGHGRTAIARAMATQARTLAYAPTLLGFSSEPAVRLASRLARMAPRGLKHVVFTCGGSESNESMIRMVRLYWRLKGRPEKIGIVALNGAYHGSSTGAASLTGLAGFHRHYEPMMSHVVRMARPYCYRCELGLTYPACALACADELERVIEREGAERIGAVVAEPVQGVGGVVVPPPGYFERLRAICDRHDVLLVVDEVITGFGRLGRPFGIMCWDVVPDMLVFAKAVTSGYQPLGGVLLHERIYRALVEAGPDFVLHNGYTYSGHPVACAAGLANLDILEREGLITGAGRKAPYFKKRLAELAASPIVGDVRAAGLMAAIELVRDKTSREPFPASEKVAWRVRQAALRRGLIIRASGDLVAICPPLVVTRAEIDAIADLLGAAIAEIADELAVPARVAGSASTS